MLIYCAWCGNYQGSTPAKGHQIRPNICEIDTSTICPPCLEKFIRSTPTATRPRPAVAATCNFSRREERADPGPEITIESPG